MTDWKELCAELLQALETEGYAHWAVTPDKDELCLRTRAELAQPEPEGMADLTDEEIDEMYHSSGGVINVFARAVWSRAQAARPAIAPISASEFLEPEWMRQEDQTRKTTDHAQLIDGEWWAPRSDLFSMQRILENARAHAARRAIEPEERWYPNFADWLEREMPECGWWRDRPPSDPPHHALPATSSPTAETP